MKRQIPAGVLHHPSIAIDTGAACTEPLTKAWGPGKGYEALAKYVLGMLTDPGSGFPVNAEASIELEADIAKFEANARRHAEKAPKA